MRKLQLELSLEHTDAVCEALNVYHLLCSGRIEEVATLIRQGVIPLADPGQSGARKLAPKDVCDQIDQLMAKAKGLLGHTPDGAMPITSPLVAKSGQRAFEVLNVLSMLVGETDKLDASVDWIPGRHECVLSSNCRMPSVKVA